MKSEWYMDDFWYCPFEYIERVDDYPLYIFHEEFEDCHKTLQLFRPFEINGMKFPKRLCYTPTEETCPTFMEWLKESRYTSAEVFILKPGASIPPHVHEEEYLYNMCISSSSGVRFQFIPGGLIPYREGDIYRLEVRYPHSVVNMGLTDRYHVVLKDL